MKFRRGGGQPISVAVEGINCAAHTVGYEGDRPFPTTGSAGFLHPYQEAPEAERRLRADAAPEFDEFLEPAESGALGSPHRGPGRHMPVATRKAKRYPGASEQEHKDRGRLATGTRLRK